MSMWLPSKAVLEAPTSNRHSIFLSQLWHELLSPSSPDSFRAKALDVPLLLEELQRICAYAQQEPKWITHVHLICEEIRSYSPFSDDSSIPTIAASALTSISNFKSAVPELPRLMEQVKISLELMRSHVDALLLSAMECVGNQKAKKRLVPILGALATHLQSRGLGEESIEKIDDSLCGLPPVEVIEHLCGEINRKQLSYSCFVSIAAPRSMASSLFADLNLREVGLTRFGGDEKALEWQSHRSEGIVVEWTGPAPSRHKAAELAVAEVLSLVHLHALYANNAIVSASPNVLIEDQSRFYVVEVTPSRHFGLEPRQNSEALSRERYTNLHGKLKGRLANLLESHALAVSASDARSAVFHLWTALETLASGLGTGSIGERVADVVAPIVAWRRADKISTYLAISGHELRMHTGAKFDRDIFQNSTKNKIDRGDILKAITGPENNPRVLGAFAAFEKSPLLTYRVYRAWEECSDPSELRKALQLSRKRIQWQVMRFYRARNLLVHYGEVDHLAMRLLENAQYYLSTCVARVLNDLSDHSDWEVNTSLEYHRHRFDSLVDRMQTKPSSVKLGDLMLHAGASYSGDLVWVKAPGNVTERAAKGAPAEGLAEAPAANIAP